MESLFDQVTFKTITASFFEASPAWNFRGVLSPFSRLYNLTSGSGFVRFANQTHRLEPGYLYVIPCYTSSDYRCPQRMEKYYVHFTSRIMGGLDLFSLYTLPTRIEVTDRDATQEAFRQMVTLSHSDRPADRVRLAGHLHFLVAGFLEGLKDERAGARAALEFREVLTFIEEHLDKPLRLEDLASFIHAHPTYFSNKFSRVFGVPPMTYLAHARVRKAQMLLWTGNESVAQVGRQVGFEDSFYFSRVFKKHTGLAPTAYRDLDHKFLEQEPPDS